MELEEARQQYRSACTHNNIAKLRHVVTSYNGNDLDDNPANSERLEFAFYDVRLEVIDYLLTSKEVKQDIQIPEVILKNLEQRDVKVIEYLCTNKNIKEKFNPLENQEHFGIALGAVTNKCSDKIVENLVLTPTTKDFWKERLSALLSVARKADKNIDIFKTMIGQVLNNKETKTKRNKDFVDMYLQDYLFISLTENNMELASYLVFDLNIKVEDYNRDIIKSDFPNGEKLLILREINKEFKKSDSKIEQLSEKVKSKKIKL